VGLDIVHGLAGPRQRATELSADDPDGASETYRGYGDSSRSRAAGVDDSLNVPGFPLRGNDEKICDLVEISLFTSAWLEDWRFIS